MNLLKLKYILLIFICGLIMAGVSNLYRPAPADRYYHIRSFRYGKQPYIIRCNRGDRLHLTFSTDDTGHSFFLSEFGMDVKIHPGTQDVTVFDALDPGKTPEIKKEVSFVADHQGFARYLVSKSHYRCHVWCGLLHGFENGSLIIFPNTLLGFGLGSLAGIFLIVFIPGIYKRKDDPVFPGNEVRFHSGITKFFTSPNNKFALRILGLVFIYVIIIISVLGTRVAGRNLGSLLVWIVWLFLLITVLTPFFGKIWCTVCPIPFFGDLLQRKKINPGLHERKGYNNLFRGLSLRWPEKLNNSWPILFTFLLLGTFSTTLVSIPKISGLLIFSLVVLATVLALVFELRAFCRYLCPINAFIGHYSNIGRLSLRAHQQQVCSDSCRAKFCKTGNSSGWACPYGLTVEHIKDNSKCGLCMECLASCSYKNTGLGFRKFGIMTSGLTISESFLGIGLMVVAVLYNIIYHGPWPALREYINIAEKDNWHLFSRYAGFLWIVSLVIVPGIIYGISWLSVKRGSTSSAFKKIAGSMIPLSLMIWVAFVIPMLLTNFTFILQSLSDPFGWGWNWFGFAGVPWIPLIPGAIPWIQVAVIIAGILFSIRNLGLHSEISVKVAGSFFVAVGAGMIFFYSYF